MANPSFRTTISVGDLKFNALACTFTAATVHDNNGMPQIGSLACSISATVDLNDTNNIPFNVLRELFDLANLPTRAKIRTIKISKWLDESQQDAVCVYTFDGWISQFTTISGDGSNHLLSLSFQPELNSQQYANIVLTN
jgi:hypothetical protein